MTLDFSKFDGFTSVLHDIDKVGGKIGSGVDELATGAGTDWLEKVSEDWIGDPHKEPYIVPLAQLVERVAQLSGVQGIAIDQSETIGVVVRVGGLD